MHAHPDELKRLLDDLRPKYRRNIDTRAWVAIQVFAETCADLEDALVITKMDDRIAWRGHLRSLQAMVKERIEGHLTIETFETLAEIAGRTWSAPCAGLQRQLPWVTNADLRRIAERDIGSALRALKTEEVKSCLILAGSVVEALLLDRLEATPEPERESAVARVKEVQQRLGQAVKFKGAPASWSLHEMVKIAGPTGLGRLAKRTEDVAQLVRDWRNYVHPDRERTETRSGDHLRLPDAMAAVALLEAVVADLTPP